MWPLQIFASRLITAVFDAMINYRSRLFRANRDAVASTDSMHTSMGGYRTSKLSSSHHLHEEHALLSRSNFGLISHHGWHVEQTALGATLWLWERTFGWCDPLLSSSL